MNCIVLDSDVVSSFAIVKRIDILISLFSKQLILLDFVRDELMRGPKYYHNIKKHIDNGEIIEKNISTSTDQDVLKEYSEITSDYLSVGKGEAIGMAYCYVHDCILASNNFKDIRKYCYEHKIQMLTVSRILYKAYNNNIINHESGVIVYDYMIQKGIKLPYISFNELINKLPLELKKEDF